MNFSQLLETKNPHYKPGEPYWELDVENKVYTVHQPDGTEVARHPFQHVWDSSPAMRAAKEDYSKVYDVYYKKKKAQDAAEAEAKPLSRLEQMYLELAGKVKRYQKYIFPKTPEDDILDKETRDLYLDTASKWIQKMNMYAEGGTIRRSIVDGTYKPPQ
jgi:hypothetical protein